MRASLLTRQHARLRQATDDPSHHFHHAFVHSKTHNSRLCKATESRANLQGTTKTRIIHRNVPCLATATVENENQGTYWQFGLTGRRGREGRGGGRPSKSLRSCTVVDRLGTSSELFFLYEFSFTTQKVGLRRYFFLLRSPRHEGQHVDNVAQLPAALWLVGAPTHGVYYQQQTEGVRVR